MEPIDVRELVAAPGSSRRLRLAERLEHAATEMASVSEPVQADLLLESVVEGILVSGPLAGRVRYRCGRCLKDFAGDFRAEVSELFAFEAPEDDADAYPLRDETIDLEPMLRDTIVLSMPFSPLCRPDCRGLCERCGGDRNLGECSCAPRTDPRWDVLSTLDLTD
jgi:uncharacterized protein